jgi:hypothetical protein
MVYAQQPATGPGLLQAYARSVEEILATLGMEPARARLQLSSGFGWSFVWGSAVIEVYVSENEGRGFFQALSPLIHLPETGLLPLYRHLLELNLSLTNAAFGVYQDVVYIYSERPLQGLDAVEASAVITAISNYADELDNVLLHEFGGRLYQQG